MAAAAQRRSEQSLNAVRGNVLSQRSVADLQRMTAEAEQQLSARDGFEFEDGHRGSGNWRPILDQNAVQLLRTLQTHQSVRYTLGTNKHAASMSIGTTRCVRKIVPPQPWQRLTSPSRGPLTERWLALAGSWSTEQAVRQLFSRRCGSTLQLESITAVCHETSLTARSLNFRTVNILSLRPRGELWRRSKFAQIRRRAPDDSTASVRPVHVRPGCSRALPSCCPVAA